jgi:hypothetical protein
MASVTGLVQSMKVSLQIKSTYVEIGIPPTAPTLFILDRTAGESSEEKAVKDGIERILLECLLARRLVEVFASSGNAISYVRVQLQ